MTDKTQPEAREFTMSQHASKDDMIGAMRKRIAELESELEAVGAGGVQALSAAPAGWKLVPVEPTVDQEWAGKNAALRCSTMGEACKIYKAMLAASPPAAQPIGEVVVTKTEYGQIVSVTRQDDEGRILSVIATSDPAEQQAAPKAAPAWADQAVIEYRYTGGTHWCPLGPAERMKPDFDGVYRLQVGVYPVEQAAPKAAPGDVLDEALRERDDAEDFIDALLNEVLGHERPEWSSSYSRADALNDVQERMAALHKPAVDKAWGQFQSAKAAPRQEA